MRFHRPFDDAQLTAAVRLHQTLRKNLKEIRSEFKPRSLQEERILGRYRDLMQSFAKELLKPTRKIDPDLLNELDAECVKTYVVYVSTYTEMDEEV